MHGVTAVNRLLNRCSVIMYPYWLVDHFWPRFYRSRATAAFVREVAFIELKSFQRFLTQKKCRDIIFRNGTRILTYGNEGSAL